jgi:hypothetical protein
MGPGARKSLAGTTMIFITQPYAGGLTAVSPRPNARSRRKM